jgi:hypothetical protein
MPTAAKLVAAVLFALLAAAGAVVYIPLLPEGTQTGWLIPGCAGLGLISGWLVMGPNVGRSYAEAVATGFRAIITAVFFAVLLFAIYVMIIRSMHMLYKGPMEALLAVFAIMLEYGKLMLDRTFIGVLAAGAAIGGVISEFVGRRWP